MMSLSQEADGDVIRLDVSGTLTREDYDAILPSLEAMLDAEDRSRILIVLDDFEGWEVSSLWEDLKFDLRHRKSFERIAVVGEGAMAKWGTELSGLLFSGETAFFDRDELSEARQWLAPRRAA
ncbi:MAG: STAS/SEC14 domain-containing protein [Azospirillaceae bacterium]